MREISKELGCGPMVIPTDQPGYAEYMDIDVEKRTVFERTETDAGANKIGSGLGRQATRRAEVDDEDSVDERLRNVAERLKEEFGDDDDSGMQQDGTELDVGASGEGGQVSVLADRRSSLKLAGGVDASSSSSSGGSTPHKGEGKEAVGTSNLSPTVMPSSPHMQTTRPALCPRNTAATRPQRPQHRCILSLRHVFDTFAADQHSILSRALISGGLHGADDSLRIAEPMPSLRETYNYRYVPSSVVEAEGKGRRRARKRRRRQWMDVGAEGDEGTGSVSYAGSGAETPVGTSVSTKGAGHNVKGTDVGVDGGREEEFYEILRVKSENEQRSDAVSTASHHSLTRVYSFVFAMEYVLSFLSALIQKLMVSLHYRQFVNELEQLYYACKNKPMERKFHVHLFETLHRPHTKPRPSTRPSPSFLPTTTPIPAAPPSTVQIDTQTAHDLSVSEALALLEHRPYVPPQHSFVQRLERAEQWFREPTSVFAAKTACAASVFAVLILHPVPRPWFIEFGMSGGALTIVTALTPTLYVELKV